MELRPLGFGSPLVFARYRVALSDQGERLCVRRLDSDRECLALVFGDVEEGPPVGVFLLFCQSCLHVTDFLPVDDQADRLHTHKCIIKMVVGGVNDRQDQVLFRDRHLLAVWAGQHCMQLLRRPRGAVLKITIELPPPGKTGGRGFPVGESHRSDLVGRQGSVVDPHVINAALEKLFPPPLRADIRRGFTLRVDLSLDRLDANFLTVGVERHGLAVIRHTDQVPFPV